jgi:outer membrane protein assembly factor BamB
VRWQFPLNNWFAYWRKEIDLPPSASFEDAAEGGAGTVFATAAGPPARVYGLRVKRGPTEQRWEWRADLPLGRLADVAGPEEADSCRRRSLVGNRGGGADAEGGGGSSSGAGVLADDDDDDGEGADCFVGAPQAPAPAPPPPPPKPVLYLALVSPDGSGSWLQALSLADGSPLWTGEIEPGVTFERMELDGPRLLVADEEAGVILAYDKATGQLLWRREGAFCATPSPIARVYAPERPRTRSGDAGGAGSRSSRGGGRGLQGSNDGSGSGGHSSVGGVLLLSRDCDALDGLSAVDSATGKALWTGLDAPHAARADGGCSWLEVDGGVAYLGCNCPADDAPVAARGATSPRPRLKLRQRGRLDGQPRLRPRHGANTSTVCVYAVDLVTGKREWWSEVEIPGVAAFDPLGQVWGQGPVVMRPSSRRAALGGDGGNGGVPAQGGGRITSGDGSDGGGGGRVVAFLTNTTVVGVSALSGKALWQLTLPPGEWLAPWQLPAQMLPPGDERRVGASPLLLLHSLRGAGNRTSVYALDGLSGKQAWTRAFNGSMQPPLHPSDGGFALPVGPLVFSEACRRGRCCLRALNATTGKQAWAVCLDAERGTDPTNPRAQFAIWVVTLVTIASVAALILGAALLYVHRWADERSLLSGGGDQGSEYEALAPSGRRHLAPGSRGGSSGSDDEGGGGGTAPRLSLFARAGGAAATVLGGPPSPGSIAAAAVALDSGSGSGQGAGGARVGGLLGQQLFGGRERVPPRGARRPADDAAAAQVGAGGPAIPYRPRVS